MVSPYSAPNINKKHSWRFESLSIRPDGRRITFASIASEGELPQVWTMENFLPMEKQPE